MNPSRKEYLSRYQNQWVKNRREQWLQANGPCRQCGSWERLEVDHIDPTQKVTHAVWSWAAPRRIQELKKCQVLCRRCHQKKSAEYLRAKRHGSAGLKCTEEMVNQILALRKQGLTQRQIGEIVGLDRSNVGRCLRGESWTWVRRKGEQLSLLPKEAA